MDITIKKIENGYTVTIKASAHGHTKEFIADDLRKALRIINDKSRMIFNEQLRD